MVYSIFIPIQIETVWFWIGIVIFGIGAIFTTIAMINFARTPHDQPVTKGMYRISRHPVQIMAIIMWLGVSAVTKSWIVAAACALLLVVYYPAFLIQERSCSNLYGNDYDEYMKNTPRYLFF
jgi:protein-S-isoprenylcysteine O-methyltransferase Ste14